MSLAFSIIVRRRNILVALLKSNTWGISSRPVREGEGEGEGEGEAEGENKQTHGLGGDRMKRPSASDTRGKLNTARCSCKQ